MSHARNLGWLAAGALLIAIDTHIPDISIAGAWFAITFLLHGWRGMSTRSGLPCLALALYAALAIANRGSIPVGGPLYFVIIAFLTALGLIPFVLDRWIGRRIVGWASSLVFPMAFVAQEFLRSRVATWSRHLGLLGLHAVRQPALDAARRGHGDLGHHVHDHVVRIDRELGLGTRVRLEHGTAPLVTYASVLGAITVVGGLRLSLSPSPPSTIRAAAVSFPRDLLTPGEMFRICGRPHPGGQRRGRRSSRAFTNGSSRTRSARPARERGSWPGRK